MKNFENDKYKISISENVIEITYLKRIIVELADAKIITKFIEENVDTNKIYGMLNNVKQIKNMSRKARDYFASQKSVTEFNAVVLGSAIQNTLFKMYLNFSKPQTVTKSFLDIKKANIWLKNQLKNF